MVDDASGDSLGEEDIEKSRMPLVEHLTELRKRMLLSLVAFVVLFFVCFYFAGTFFNFLVAPLAQVAGWPVLLLSLLVMPLVFGEIPVHDALVAQYGAPQWRARIYGLKYVLSLGVSSAAVPLVAWLHLAGAPGGNGFVVVYWALAGAAAIVVAASLLLPGRRELSAQAGMVSVESAA